MFLYLDMVKIALKYMLQDWNKFNSVKNLNVKIEYQKSESIDSYGFSLEISIRRLLNKIK